MTTTFDTVLAKALEDEAFERNLIANPEETLKSYNLKADEVTALKTLQSQVFEALRRREQAKADAKSWWRPTNFRETGAAILSAILVGLLLYAAVRTFSQVSTVPVTYKIDDNVQVVDTFDRAKDLLNIFFPLFGAVITFWLGVTVEGRRADRNEAEANQAKTDKGAAEGKTEEIRSAANAALDKAEGAVLRQMQTVGSGSAFESSNVSARPANQAELQGALETILAARRQISR